MNTQKKDSLNNSNFLFLKILYKKIADIKFIETSASRGPETKHAGKINSKKNEILLDVKLLVNFVINYFHLDRLYFKICYSLLSKLNFVYKILTMKKIKMTPIIDPNNKYDCFGK